MKFCPYCGNELNDNHQFCPYCGKSIAAESADNTNTTGTTTLEKKAKPKKKIIPIAIILLLIAVLVAVLLTNPFKGNFSDSPNAIQKASDSVVKIYMYDINGTEVGTGSGFAALDDGIIITNHHCIKGNVYSIEAERADHSFFSIESVVAYDEEKDIAILRAPEGKLAPLKTGSSMDLKRGEKTVAIGSPIGLQQMVSTGIFSNYLNEETHFIILSTASISQGSSGGALFNNHGEVIGVTSAYYTHGNDLYMSVPIYYVQELYNNRDPKDELTVPEFYDLSEHPYDVDYLLAFGNKLQGQEITAYGYIGGVDTNLYLVSSLDQVLLLDARDDWTPAQQIEITLLLRELPAVQIQRPNTDAFSSDLMLGDLIAVEGTLRYYSASDIRIVPSKLFKLE